MLFSELRGSLQKIKKKKSLFDLPDHMEFVITTEELGSLTGELESFFGPASKPAGEIPQEKWKKLMEHHGSIRIEQTLYTIERDGSFFHAALWPWADKSSITVRVGRSPL